MPLAQLFWIVLFGASLIWLNLASRRTAEPFRPDPVDIGVAPTDEDAWRDLVDRLRS